MAAVTRRLVIRESTGDEYEAVYALLKLCEKGTPVTDDDAKSTPATGDNVKSMPVTDDNAGTGREESYRIFADGFDLTAIDSRETFLQYVNACYRFFGFGVWTVLLKEGIGQEEAVCLDADPDKVDPLGSALDKTVPLDGDPDKAEKVIGWCGLFPKKDKGEAGFHIELGYAIAPAFQRKGYGYEACCAILDYARKELELEPGQIVIRADGRNTAALRLAHKLGLEAEVV